VACATAGKVLLVDADSGTVTESIPVPGRPTGLAVSRKDGRLFVTCGETESVVAVIDPAKRRVVERLKAGHTATAPVLSPDGRRLFVCNRFNDNVGCYDLDSKKELYRVQVQREPVAAAITLDGRFLLVANLLHNGPADATEVAAVVSVIDTAAGRVVKECRLPNGSGSLHDLRVSPDGKFAVVTHLLSRFHLPTTQLDRGWMNTNAKTIIDLEKLEVVSTILLDSVDRGAANPWGIAWSADSRTLVIAHAGTHEISVIDFPAVLAKLARIPREAVAGQAVDYGSASRVQADVPNDLAFLVGAQRRIKLPEGELGPRSVLLLGTRLYVANYFSDTLASVDVTAAYPQWKSIALGPKIPLTAARQGELYFHDARICFQGWQSCASCHPGDARVDALNWDLLNDGVGNPKNNKSLLLALRTPPAMSRGVRETGEEAVRAGIRHILFSVQPEEVGKALDAYLASLSPVPSPRLDSGSLSRAAKRGRKVFNDPIVGCASCHPAGLFTDLHSYDVGTAGQFDKPGDRFDTPTLVELWRTAPYLHDGSAATVREVLTTRNAGDKHGRISQLREQEINDLVEYLLSL
jgi:DNA-binding beta-propeller fold protein YncE/mono/diheme cytochrome c family protein